MNEVQKIIEAAQQKGQRALSEYESKRVLATYGLPVVDEVLVQELGQLKEAAGRLGFPVVLKICSAQETHKTEKGLIELDLRTPQDLEQAYARLISKVNGGEPDFLLQKMVKGARELVLGMTRDQQFGPVVMFGLGGIFTEILHDVAFRVAPLSRLDAQEMMGEIRGRKILDAVRGMPAVDVEALIQGLIGLGRIGLEHEAIQEIDVNPLIVVGNKPVAVDALVVLKG